MSICKLQLVAILRYLHFFGNPIVYDKNYFFNMI